MDLIFGINLNLTNIIGDLLHSKATLPATPSTPSCPDNKGITRDIQTSEIQSSEKLGVITDMEDPTSQIEKATPKRRGRPKKVLKLIPLFK